MASKEKDGIRRVEGKKGVSWQAKANAAGNKPVYQTFKSRTDAKHWKASIEAVNPAVKMLVTPLWGQSCR